MGLLAEYICYQWYSITTLTMLALILFFLITMLMVLIVGLHHKIYNMPWLCLLQQICDVKVCIGLIIALAVVFLIILIVILVLVYQY